MAKKWGQKDGNRKWGWLSLRPNRPLALSLFLTHLPLHFFAIHVFAFKRRRSVAP
jgi:hypothetical protein